MDNQELNTIELEQLRGQMAELREKLDQQQIVTPEVVRKTMSNKYSWIKKFVWFEIAIVPVLLAVVGVTHYQLGLSWWLYGFMAVMLVADVVADYCINNVDTDSLLMQDVMTASAEFVRMKKRRLWAFAISVGALLVWLAWLILELSRVAADKADSLISDFSQGALWGVIPGAVIGFVIAIYIFVKMQRTNDEIINQINEMKQD